MTKYTLVIDETQRQRIVAALALAASAAWAAVEASPDDESAQDAESETRDLSDMFFYMPEDQDEDSVIHDFTL